MKYLTGIAVALILLVSCRSQVTRDSWEQLEALREQIEADGLVSPAEAEQYVQAVEAHLALEREEMSDTNWGELLATAGGTLLASFFGINAYRNRSLPGTSRKDA